MRGRDDVASELAADEAVLLEIRDQLLAAGATTHPKTDLANIALVLRHTGHPDLTVDALLMHPRPIWLSELVGSALRRPAKPLTRG